MTKTLEITVDIDIARKMLVVAGFTNLKSKTDEEIFDLAVSMNSEYGVTAKEVCDYEKSGMDR